MKPLSIGVFGSSYSRGNSEVIDPERPHAKVSVTGWPYELSEICEHQIYNHSIGGASVDFMLKQYWKQNNVIEKVNSLLIVVTKCFCEDCKV